MAKLAIIIPAFNEELYVQKLVKKVASVKYPCYCQIIFVNDGSTDRVESRQRAPAKIPLHYTVE
jgi:glycosyltransferase involved in cell wall biosynthesis